VARGYAAKGYGAGPDYGRYWITAAGLEYLAAVDHAADADADADEDPDLVDVAADADDDFAFAAVPVGADVSALRCATLATARVTRKLTGVARKSSSLSASLAASSSTSHVWDQERRSGMPKNPFDDGDVDDSSSDFDSEGSDDDDSGDDTKPGREARNVICRLAHYCKVDDDENSWKASGRRLVRLLGGVVRPHGQVPRGRDEDVAGLARRQRHRPARARRVGDPQGALQLLRTGP
jgi:hypothetical protein